MFLFLVLDFQSVKCCYWMFLINSLSLVLVLIGWNYLLMFYSVHVLEMGFPWVSLFVFLKCVFNGFLDLCSWIAWRILIQFLKVPYNVSSPNPLTSHNLHIWISVLLEYLNMSHNFQFEEVYPLTIWSWDLIYFNIKWQFNL